MFGVTYILRYTDGPHDTFLQIRQFLGVVEDVDGNETARTEFGKMILCWWCLSTWAALVIALIAFMLYDLPFLWSFLYPIGFSGYLHERIAE